jgi:hypothetical protein
MKRKGPSKIRRVDHFFKPIASGSDTNIASAENANPSDEQQPVVHGSSNPVDMDSDNQNIMEREEISEQVRIGSTPFDSDPGKRQQIWELPLDKQEEARRFYIREGPYQPYMPEYPFNGTSKNRRRFQFSYFTNFPWLEYSPTTYRAYCLPCFVFTKKPSGKCGSDAFTFKGFRNWKKVNDGKECALLTHMGKDSKSAHNFQFVVLTT